MRGGLLDRRVIFQEKKAGRKPDGQPENTWVEIFKAWARVNPIRSKEEEFAGRDVSIVRYAVIIRSRKGISNGMRVVCDVGSLEVVSASPLHGKRDFTEVICQTSL